MSVSCRSRSAFWPLPPAACSSKGSSPTQVPRARAGDHAPGCPGPPELRAALSAPLSLTRVQVRQPLLLRIVLARPNLQVQVLVGGPAGRQQANMQSSETGSGGGEVHGGGSGPPACIARPSLQVQGLAGGRAGR